MFPTASSAIPMGNTMKVLRPAMMALGRVLPRALAAYSFMLFAPFTGKAFVTKIFPLESTKMPVGSLSWARNPEIVLSALLLPELPALYTRIEGGVAEFNDGIVT